MRLGNDHTSGLAAGKLHRARLLPITIMRLASSSKASRTVKFWASTAIFIIEDDAQNGPDHVDSHRAPACIISPYTRRGAVDSTMYNQTSILRTMEGSSACVP